MLFIVTVMGLRVWVILPFNIYLKYKVKFRSFSNSEENQMGFSGGKEDVGVIERDLSLHYSSWLVVTDIKSSPWRRESQAPAPTGKGSYHP